MVDSKKLSRTEWAELIERGINRHELFVTRQRRRLLRRYVPIPILIGLATCLLYVLFWGWVGFLQTFASWVIGVTIVTTLFALLADKGVAR